jgi:hypothetical protein
MFLVAMCQHVSGACPSHSRPVLSLSEASWKYAELSHSTPPFLTLCFHKKDLLLTPRLLRVWPILPPLGHILSVKHYQADNGRFSDKEFLAACNNCNQTIEFCGFDTHHQNEINKNRNKQLTQTARVLLLHGMRMWPQMLDQMLWPFAIKAAAERMNSLYIDTDGYTPKSKFYCVNI